MKCLFKKIFSIEGNIGAGKSTLLEMLEKKIPNCLVIQEPVMEWKNIGGGDLLAAFYEEPERWCFTFEIYSMFTLLKKLKSALTSDADVILMERSIFSNRAFHQISYVMDKMDAKEMAVLKELYEYFKLDYPGLNGVIYLDTDVETCLQRITQRGRQEENKVNYIYLKKLEEQFKITRYGCKMMEINGKYNMEKPQEIIDSIKKFIDNN